MREKQESRVKRFLTYELPLQPKKVYVELELWLRAPRLSLLVNVLGAH